MEEGTRGAAPAPGAGGLGWACAWRWARGPRCTWRGAGVRQVAAEPRVPCPSSGDGGAIVRGGTGRAGALGPRCSAPGGRLGGGTSCLPSGQQGGPYQPCFLEKALIVTVILVTATPVQCFSWAGPWSEVCTDRLVQASQPRGLDWAGEATWAQRGAA